MKTLALALLIPVAICTACGNREEPIAETVTEPAATAAVVDTPAPSPAAVPADANAAGPTPPADASAPPQTTAQVSFTSAAGSAVNGTLTVTHEGGAVSIRGDIAGLSPGKEHGFHVHEIGECSLPDFQSAGEHFNPTKDPHGGPKSTARHLGDMPNAKADANGRATVDVTLKGVTLVDTDGAPTQILGKSLVVHAMPDDYGTQPSGNSGARIACGVIR